MSGIKVVGILNVTPDSFYVGSRAATVEAALLRADEMIKAGADVIDIGGESTRPGGEEISSDEELERVVPVLQAISAMSDITLSIDTRKAAVAEAAIEAGARMVNDVSGLCFDAAMPALLATRPEVSVVIMHMRGTPQDMQDDPYYDDTIAEIRRELSQRVEKALREGIAPHRIVLDPGIGFSKRTIDNLRILRNLSEFRELGFPLYLGPSRKSFIGTVLADGDARVLPAEDRLAGTLAVLAWSVLQGVEYLRVHDVRETVHVVNMLQALKAAG